MGPYKELLRLTAAAPTDDDAAALADLVRRDATFLARSPLDITVPWLLASRPIPGPLLDLLDAEDARSLTAGDLPMVRFHAEPTSWLGVVRWAARTADHALPHVTVSDAPSDLVDVIWRGVALALLESGTVLSSVVIAARLLRWVGILGLVDDDRGLFEDACRRVRGLGTLDAEAQFHLFVARRNAS